MIRPGVLGATKKHASKAKASWVLLGIVALVTVKVVALVTVGVVALVTIGVVDISILSNVTDGRRGATQTELSAKRRKEDPPPPPRPPTPPKFGLTVVHCRERNVSQWISDVPADWDLTVYEACGENISAASVPFQNAGNEECTAYLQTMIRQYDDLPDVNVFVQSDVLLGTGRDGKKFVHEHSPFDSIEELIRATGRWWWGDDGGGVVDDDDERGFLHFGPEGQQLQMNIARGDPYVEGYPKEVFDTVGLNYTDETMARTRSGACFAVSRARIRSNSIETYRKLQESLLDKESSVAKKLCCGLENTWHAMLGEPYMLPTTSTVDRLWKVKAADRKQVQQL